MDTRERRNIKSGQRVMVLEQENKTSGELTEGLVDLIITKAPSCPSGIKVQLKSGKIGRVKEIVDLKP